MRWIVENAFEPRYTFWTRANVSEVLPEPPSPLGWDVVWEGAAVAGWRDLFVQRLGMPDDELDPFRAEMIGIHGGYAYLGASLFRVWAGRTPGMTPTTIDEVYFGDHPDVPPYVRGGLARQRPNLRGDGRMAGVGNDRRHAGRAASRPGGVAANSCATARLQRAVGRSTARVHRLASAAVPADVPPAHQPVDRRLDRAGHPCAGLHCDRRAALGHETDDRARRCGLGSPRLCDVAPVARGAGIGCAERAVRQRVGWPLRGAARSADSDAKAFAEDFDRFLAEFGSRGANEWDLIARVWELEPDTALSAVDRMRMASDDASPIAENEARERERRDLTDRVRGSVGR